MSVVAYKYMTGRKKIEKLKQSSDKVVAFTCERWSLRRGFHYSDLPGITYFGKVVAYGRRSLTRGVHIGRFDFRNLHVEHYCI